MFTASKVNFGSKEFVGPSYFQSTLSGPEFCRLLKWGTGDGCLLDLLRFSISDGDAPGCMQFRNIMNCYEK